jgi:hypothetical protein
MQALCVTVNSRKHCEHKTFWNDALESQVSDRKEAPMCILRNYERRMHFNDVSSRDFLM